MWAYQPCRRSRREVESSPTVSISVTVTEHVISLKLVDGGVGTAGGDAVGVSTHRMADKYVTGRVQARNLKESSAREVRHTLRRFAEFVPDVNRITRSKVRKWMASCKVSAGTLRSYFVHVKKFCQWLVLEGHLPKDPTLGIDAPKKPEYMPRALEPWEVALLLKACKDQRERLMVVLMAQEGFRCCEVARLRLGDIDERRGQITVKGKGDRTRTVPLVDQAHRELRRYLACTPLTTDGPLFPSRRTPHRSISANWVSELVGNIFRRSGVKHRPYDGKSPHALRHTCLSDIVDRGEGDILEAQAIAGHADLSTTQVYMRHRKAEQLRPAMEGRHYGDDVEPPGWAATA
jgi:site-specific recombinase XerD